MDHKELGELFSRERIQAYIVPGQSPAMTIDRYQWNIRLSAAMLPCLHYMEIILRNRVDAAIESIFGNGWLMSPPQELQLSRQTLDNIADAKRRIRRAHHGDIVAQMSFGFWSAFFNRRYDELLWQRKGTIQLVFPNLARQFRNRRQIEAWLSEIKEIRNRIAHHEPIWNRPLEQSHKLVLHFVESMSRPARELLADVDTWQNVYEKALASKTISRIETTRSIIR